MCGIVGFLDKRPGPDQPVGRILLAMLRALGCRGPDSAGLAVFNSDGSDWFLRLKAPDGLAPADVHTAVAAPPRSGLQVQHHHAGNVFDVLVPAGADAAALEADVLRRVPDSEVLCLGGALDLFKQVGSPDRLETDYHVSTLSGTHGIGHTRLSTESKVDLSHSQPFWAHGVADLATVHNGHITNYHKLRRRYEQKGHRFHTENDSEVIGVYLRDRLSAGLPLAEALRASQSDFDGSFCYLAATADVLAVVKDGFGFKPLVAAETADFVALATEEVALRRALGTAFPARELDPGTVKIWQARP
jgi:glutamine phosphoribosylpyrophosphate amidotransferase